MSSKPINLIMLTDNPILKPIKYLKDETKKKKIFNLKKITKKFKSIQTNPTNLQPRSWDHDNLGKIKAEKTTSLIFQQIQC